MEKDHFFGADTQGKLKAEEKPRTLRKPLQQSSLHPNCQVPGEESEIGGAMMVTSATTKSNLSSLLPIITPLEA